MKNTLDIQTERTRIIAELNDLLAKLKLTQLSAESIIDLVYHAGERWGQDAHHLFQKELHQKTKGLKDPDQFYAVLELAFQCWNYFPHKDMGDESPYERMQHTETALHTDQDQLPSVVMGEQKMSFVEYQAMLEEMEKTQEPFKQWLEQEVLPSYKQFLEAAYQQKTVEKHYTIAEILCGRLLHVGFVTPEHVRPEFLYDEFPVWWQTHVMFADYKENTVANSVVHFVNFIEATMGISLDAVFVKSSPNQWT